MIKINMLPSSTASSQCQLFSRSVWQQLLYATFPRRWSTVDQLIPSDNHTHPHHHGFLNFIQLQLWVIFHKVLFLRLLLWVLRPANRLHLSTLLRNKQTNHTCQHYCETNKQITPVNTTAKQTNHTCQHYCKTNKSHLSTLLQNKT